MRMFHLPRIGKSSIFIALAWLFSSALWASSEPTPSIVSPSQQLPLGQSLDAVSAYFVGVSFVESALGEGPGQYDSDPLFRVDGFDCTTFVETVWAISLSKPSKDWTQSLQAIRYRGGKPSFVNRLHFISLEWMPYHLARGALEDITSQMGAPVTESSTLIDRKAWFKKLHPSQLKNFELTFPQDVPEKVLTTYVPFSALLDSPSGIATLKNELKKNALLINFIRPDWDTVRWIGTKIDVSHQGFLFIKGDHIVLRHASAPNKRVIETNFLDYIRFHRDHPTLKGIQVIRIKTL